MGGDGTDSVGDGERGETERRGERERERGSGRGRERESGREREREREMFWCLEFCSSVALSPSAGPRALGLSETW